MVLPCFFLRVKDRNLQKHDVSKFSVVEDRWVWPVRFRLLISPPLSLCHFPPITKEGNMTWMICPSELLKCLSCSLNVKLLFITEDFDMSKEWMEEYSTWNRVQHDINRTACITSLQACAKTRPTEEIEVEAEDHNLIQPGHLLPGPTLQN